MKVLIFGVTGNCGKYTARHFKNLGWDVYGVGRSKQPDFINNIKFIQGDIQDDALYEILPKNVDLVINFAGVQPSILPTSENTDLTTTLKSYLDVNISGVFKVLEFVRVNKIPTYIYSTTHRDYELHWDNNKFLGNDLPPAINYKGDHTMYAISKTSAKMMGDYYSEAFGTRVFNLRLPMIFMVPEDEHYLKDGKPTVMPFLQIIKKAMSGDDLQIWGNPDLTRDYVHIDNLISLIELAFESKLKSGTFNVGTGEAVKTEDFVRTIGDVFSPHPSEVKYTYHPTQNTYKCAVYDVNETKELLGYKPILLKEMLQRLKQEMTLQNSTKKWGWE